MNGTPRTNAEVISQAIDWELSCRDFYSRIADTLGSDHKSQSAFWRQMAIEESSHASLLREIAETMSPQVAETAADTSTVILADSVDGELGAALSLSLKTLDDAYDVAHRLESSEINTVFRIYAIPSIDEDARQKLLSEQLDKHVARLETYGTLFPRSVRQNVSCVYDPRT